MPVTKSDGNGGDGSMANTLARFCSELTYEDLSPEVVDWAKYLCLDFAGVALNGSTTQSAQTVVQAVESVQRPGPSIVIGTSKRFLPEYAAMANATAFHSIELDDTNNEASVHVGTMAFPTALAMADVARVDGKNFITSVVAGYEVTVRLGRALKPAAHYDRGFHPTGTCGAFGAAAVASRALGLDADSTTAALGVAGSQAAGSLEFLTDGAWTKRLHPGWASNSGIWAAVLAQAGFLGPASIIEGRWGFLHAYSGDPDPDLVLKDLGSEFQITRMAIKPHSCCRYSQGPIDCLLDLRERQNVKAEDVEKVTVGVLSGGFEVVATPEEDKRNPKSVVDMQFSMPFGAAVALLYGQASLAEFTTEVAQRPEVKEMMSRIHCVTDPALDSLYPQMWPAWAEVATTDGRTLRSSIEYPKGDPNNALSWQEMKDKFTALTAPVISKERQAQIIAAIEALDDMADVRELAELLRVEQPLCELERHSAATSKSG
jgi:2-methylcitrate dehydratase PrpD